MANIVKRILDAYNVMDEIGREKKKDGRVNY